MRRLKRRSFGTAFQSVVVLCVCIAFTGGRVQAATKPPSPDGYQHVIVATGGGEIDEVYFAPKDSTRPRGQDVLTSVPGAVAVSGYYAG
jgi:hypothetical protein